MTGLLTDNLPLLAGAPNGIQKLRELILGLAIQGKLLAQDEGEGNVKLASETLGITKRARRESLLREFSIPKAWDWFCVSDLCDLKTGATPRTSNPDYYGGDIKWLVSGDIHKGEIYDCAGRITEAALEQSNCKIIQPGAVLIALNGQGKTRATTAILRAKAACNQSLVAIVPRWPGFISSEFIRLNLRYRYFEIRDITGQNQRRGLNMGLVGELSISAAPIREQHRIVAKVGELMALCDTLETQQANAESAHAQLVQALLDSLTQASDADDFAASWQRLSEHFDTLFTTEASIDALKQTLLQLAVMGKLVAQDPSDESASELLSAIAAEKLRMVADGNVRPPKQLAEITEDEKPYELPPGWEWGRLGSQVVESGAGWSPSCESRPRKGNEWGVLKVSAVSWGTYQPEQNKALPAGLAARPEHEVAEGDFLVSRANTAELVARSVVVEETPCRLMLSDKIVRLKLTGRCNSRYINLVNSSPQARAYFSHVAGGTSSSMKNVSRDQILNLPIPVAPLAEQHRIVVKFDELMSLCDELKSRMRIARDLNQQLASSLVESSLT